jgi:hypothetical protein
MGHDDLRCFRANHLFIQIHFQIIKPSCLLTCDAGAYRGENAHDERGLTNHINRGHKPKYKTVAAPLRILGRLSSVLV